MPELEAALDKAFGLGVVDGPTLGAALDNALGPGVADGTTFGEALGDKLVGPTLWEWLVAALGEELGAVLGSKLGTRDRAETRPNSRL
jgi:hypothetical protein